ncbi:cadherin-1 [Danio rerio]|uniref:Cadherin-1 n=1 Tax=Danio rerio TaxID=7955 RepID=A0A8M6YZI6_DANRE|nr:cadherin-1 [Danio rerio]|eukprot:XP_017212586.1 cadherin-1 [Danio rerio]
MTVRLGTLFVIFKILSCGFAEESPCTPGFESKLLVVKVHKDHLHKGERLGRVVFSTCDGRTGIDFQSTDQEIDLNMDGTLMMRRSVTLHEGLKEFSVSAWDFSGKKHTVFVRVERVDYHKDHDVNTLMNTSSVQTKSLSDDLILIFPKSSLGLNRAKRCWILPPLTLHENGKGPFPMRLFQIKSDSASETPMAYKITGEGADQDPKGIFQIDRLSGWVSVTQQLDREKKASYKLVAHATGVDANIVEKPFEFIVTVMDQNDNKPVFTQNPFNANVPEALEKGEVFMTVTATDADDKENTDNADISYAIISQDPPSPKPNMFAINPVSGGISMLETGLDREQWSSYTLVITATDMNGEGGSTTGTAVITVTDSNNNAPLFEQTLYTVSVPENQVGAEVAKLPVTDGDEPESTAWSTKYRVIGGDKGGFFNVSTGPSRLEGVITTVKPLNYEKNKQYILSVIVVNDDKFVGPLPTSTATVTVNVEDENEPPEFNPKEKFISKPEDLPVGSDLVNYTATDPDTEKKQKIIYRIGNDPSGWLSVTDAGQIQVKKPMDRENPSVKDGKYKAVILALDDADTPTTGTGTLVIELQDVNDNAPVIHERTIELCNQDSGPVLLSITDNDGPPFAGPFTVEPQGDTSKNWSVFFNETGHYLSLKPQSQLEQREYNLVLRVTDREGQSQESAIQASVCDCKGEAFQCTNKQVAGVPLLGFLGILGGILLFVLLILKLYILPRYLLFFSSCSCRGKTTPLLSVDDVRVNICYDDEECGGEGDQN